MTRSGKLMSIVGMSLLLVSVHGTQAISGELREAVYVVR